MCLKRMSLVMMTSLLIGVTWAAPATAATECGNQKATLTGTDGNDRLIGTPNDDVIVGLGGNDRIKGLGGNDLLCGGDGVDVIRGGGGSDFLAGGSGRDREFGGKGSDNFSVPADEGNDHLDGGYGNDYLFFNRARSSVVVDLAKGFARFDGQNDSLEPGSFETVYGSPGADRILGDDDSNVLFGGFDSEGDVIKGRGGSDYLEGYESDDVLSGGEGDDVLMGHYGQDDINGGAGTDLLRICGVFSQDAAACGNGSPIPPTGVTIDLATGTMTGGSTLSGIENVEGTATRDEISGSDGANALYGGPRDDSISGGDGDDVIVGDASAPLPRRLEERLGHGLEGPDGDDDLNGGPGFDSIDGNGGSDTCSEGESTSNCEG